MAKGLETVGSKSPRAPPVDKRVEEGEFIQEGDVRVAQLLAKAVAGCGHIGEGLDLSHGQTLGLAGRGRYRSRARQRVEFLEVMRSPSRKVFKHSLEV